MLMNLPPFDPQALTLADQRVRLLPLQLDHVQRLCEIGLDADLWRWTPSSISTPAQMRAYVDQALADQARGSALPFVIEDREQGRVVGSTRFGNISRQDRRLEIGWTWLARSHQRSHVNTHAKFLLLQHAFEALGALRVELKTDALNAASRAAIARIGATQEGIFRQHMVCESGRLRDTVYFSIIHTEWPALKSRLLALRR